MLPDGAHHCVLWADRVGFFSSESEGQCKDIDLDAYSHLVLSEML